MIPPETTSAPVLVEVDAVVLIAATEPVEIALPTTVVAPFAMLRLPSEDQNQKVITFLQHLQIRFTRESNEFDREVNYSTIGQQIALWCRRTNVATNCIEEQKN